MPQALLPTDTPRVAGIICECNPFHNGHARLLREVRKVVGEDGCIVCLMSGSFVQRGVPAAADPYLRAHATLIGVADLVLELPFPWSAADAERFAAAGISVLSRLPVELVAFGSESGDRTLLENAAALLARPGFEEHIAERVRAGTGAATALGDYLRRELAPSAPPDFPSSNDLLAIQYLRALQKSHAPMQVLTVKREGQDYRDDLLRDPNAPSATALRVLMREAAGDPDCLSAMLSGSMPDEALALWLDAVRCGAAPAAEDALLPFLHAYYRLADPEALSALAGLSGGLAHRITRAALDAPTPSAFWDALRSRLYTDARLRRALLFGAVGVTDGDLRSEPAHTTLLAANRRGCALLQARRRTDSSLSIVTKPADAPTDRQTYLARRADALYTLTTPKPTAAGAGLRRGAFIEKE